MCLAEECAEVQQAIAKALRFGLCDGYPGTDRTNAEDIAAELDDLTAVAEMLQDEAVLRKRNTEAVYAKVLKVVRWMHYAEERKTLEEKP